MPQEELLRMLEGVVGDDIAHSDCSFAPAPRAGPGAVLVSTTDFFFPIVDDPYAMGRIGAANVLSDLYSTGIDTPDSVLMLLAAPEEIPDPGVRKTVTQLMMRGFADAAREAGCPVSGGQSVRNPWPIIGGVASAAVREQDILRPVHAVPGDVVVLTKPLGTQIAANAH